MKSRLTILNYRTILRVLFFAGSILLFPSCMMMTPVHHMQHNEHHEGEISVLAYIDPVCGQQIEYISNKLTYEYRGVSYYFHSGECMDSFKHSPGKYLRHNPDNYIESHNNYWLWRMGGVAMGTMMVFMFL